MNTTCENGWQRHVRRACDTCAVRDEGLCGSLTSEELAELNLIARMKRLDAGQRVISDQEPTDYFGIILSGAVKLNKVLPDGRQQIVALLFPSDFVGRPFLKLSGYNAEATTDVQICTFRTAQFEALLQRFPGIEHQLFGRSLRDLDAAHDWMLLLGRKTAREKLASLLLMIADRISNTQTTSAATPQPSPTLRFNLPLSRSEIADFLGLRLETVSRQFHWFKSQGIIKLQGARSLVICDRPRLEIAAASSPARAPG